LPERERENFNQAVFALAFSSRRQDRELPGAYNRPDDAVIRVYDDAGNMIETHEHAGDFRGP
jgi:hypothetical protein